MSKKSDDIFRQLFGISWDTILEADPNIGAFVLLHDTKEAVADKNALKIMGFVSDPTYNELLDTLSKAQEYSDGRAPILLKYIDTGIENTTAGIIHLDLRISLAIERSLFVHVSVDVITAAVKLHPIH